MSPSLSRSHETIHAPRPAPAQDAAAHQGIVVAIDGPAGSGKSSTARAVAAELGFAHLDSGAFYRAATYGLLNSGIPTSEWPLLTTQSLEELHIGYTLLGRHIVPTVQGRIVENDIRSREVSIHTPRLASVPVVRSWLLDLLRSFRRENLVADGRDIGTVVFPDADLKIFLVCAPEVRARRRLRDHGEHEPSDEEIQAETARLKGRDEADSSRAVAPLLQAPDAVEVDTTRMSFAEQVDAIVRLARERARGLDAGEEKP